jgi:hypothetical protein
MPGLLWSGEDGSDPLTVFWTDQFLLLSTKILFGSKVYAANDQIVLLQNPSYRELILTRSEGRISAHAPDLFSRPHLCTCSRPFQKVASLHMLLTCSEGLVSIHAPSPFRTFHLCTCF